MLVGIPEADWERPTPAAGWSIRDQLSHLAFFDGAARQSIAEPDAFRAALAEATKDIDGYVAATLSYGRGIPGAELLDRFTAERRALVVTRRRLAADSDLVVDGDDARTWIGFAQAFAGNPTDTDRARSGL